MRDRPSKSPDCREETAPSLPEEDSNRCARPTRVFLLGLAFENVFSFDCFFLTVFFGAFACSARDTFFGRFEVAVFDFLCLLLIFFLLEGIGAVYHRG